ncbi:RNA polymerase II holoenzyme cyclin-like subunit [Lunasporangiospora selenospora]|uniref:RNA polymerase II holoenzyme cyclin-like subunit n=1 Tax=Lunasporangiospora selenospora TaxID=979761 RepID=A0A9P6FWH4_9FUNG|nr:RNA polymerase II holoenzyme cyclin-like subunit [Lunasporangiospora selenospora]
MHRRRLAEAMKEDLEYVDIATLTKIKMWYYNSKRILEKPASKQSPIRSRILIGKIGKRLQFRQQVIATAIVYFKRFYTKNSLRMTDPSLVAATCIYLACKIEECPQHIKHIITEMKNALANHGGFDYDTSKVAEFEFYLLEELEFYLIVYHPYRDLTLIAKDLKLEESNLQTAWFVINDSYRTDVCLLYAPHMIALAALYIICVVHAERTFTDTSGGGNIGSSNPGNLLDDNTANSIITHSTHSNMHLHAQLNNMASKRSPHHALNVEGHGINNRDMVQWFADLNVEMEEIIEITQEMLSLYNIWKDYGEENIPSMIKILKAKRVVDPSISHPQHNLLHESPLHAFNQQHIHPLQAAPMTSQPGHPAMQQ